MSARYNHERIGADVLERALHGEGRSVADLHHGDDRRHADDDAERGKEVRIMFPLRAPAAVLRVPKESHGDPSMSPSLMRMLLSGRDGPRPDRG